MKGQILHVEILKKLKALKMLMKLRVKENVMRKYIARTCGQDRKIKNASYIAHAIHWSIIRCQAENSLRRN